jgi:hypothetical protein
MEAILASLEFSDAIAPPSNATSGWSVFDSELGFTMKYPSGWTVVDLDVEGLPQGHVRLMNPKAVMESERRVAAGIHEGGIQDGEVWIEVTPQSFDTFALAIGSCGNGPGTVVTSLGGRPAVRCSQEGRSAYDPEHIARSEIVYVEMPSGEVVGIAAAIFGSATADGALAIQAMSTLTVPRT